MSPRSSRLIIICTLSLSVILPLPASANTGNPSTFRCFIDPLLFWLETPTGCKEVTSLAPETSVTPSVTYVPAITEKSNSVHTLSSTIEPQVKGASIELNAISKEDLETRLLGFKKEILSLIPQSTVSYIQSPSAPAYIVSSAAQGGYSYNPDGASKRYVDDEIDVVNARVDSISTIQSGQWNTNNGALYYSGGNVGIGTSSPGRVLTVSSGTSNGALFTGTGTAAYTSFTQTSATSSEFRIWPSNNGFIYLQHDRDLSFTAIQSASARFTIGVSGDIGIASSSPVAALSIQRNINNSTGFWISNTNSGSSASARVTLSAYASVEASLPSYIDWNAYNSQLKFVAGRNNLGQHMFSTINGGSEQVRMVIRNNGNVGIGTSSPVSLLSVAGAINSTDLLGGATTLSVDANGNIIRTPSDQTLKKDITPISGALDKVLQLQGVTYNWIDSSRFGTEREMGLIAQQIEPIVPEVVKSGGTYKSVNYQNLVALLIEAIKDLSNKVDTMAVWFKDDNKTFAVPGDAKVKLEGQFCVEELCMSKQEFKTMMLNSKNGAVTPVVIPIQEAPEVDNINIATSTDQVGTSTPSESNESLVSETVSVTDPENISADSDVVIAE